MNIFSRLFTKTVLRLQPGDVVVFKLDGGAPLPTGEEFDALMENFREVFPDNRALFIEGVSIYKIISKNPVRVKKMGNAKVAC